MGSVERLSCLKAQKFCSCPPQREKESERERGRLTLHAFDILSSQI